MDGKELIKKWEGCKLVAYLCPAGIPTIGYGHTKDVKLGDLCTQEQAEEWLREDMQEAEVGIKRCLTIPISRNQMEALVSFVFNLGIGNLRQSTLLKYLNQGEYEQAANQFVRWNKSKGQVLEGLTNRRLDEKQLFLTK